ncbi:alpha-amylase family glycosyl hydrolase [Sphaerothrix gracilis]|uniref:alpha-amylase family glycosyl hydrolase n=1 Tax=Sphaerothrix gracilis TaxID=3151835 RepID=UPI0031FD7ADA
MPLLSACLAVLVSGYTGSPKAIASEQPTAIFHAFDQPYREVERAVCQLAEQGYSHIQIAPAQKSHPSPNWWARYQPIDYSVIEGRGSEADLQALIATAHGCQVQVIADVVLNHMANLPEYATLGFPQFSPADFNNRCEIDYGDGDRTSETDCWLGGLPDLNQTRPNVQALQQAYLQKLLDLGIDGFRVDAAKHIPASTIKTAYIDYINQASQGETWNYLEVITDSDTRPEDYNWIAAVTDFVLYNAMRTAFSFGGDLRSLRLPAAIADPHSVTFGHNHDTILALNDYAINPYDEPTDAHLATAYVLARQSGTPLIFGPDNAKVPYIPYGVKFRQIMRQRAEAGQNVDESVLAAIDSSTVLLLERGTEGFFVVNKAAEQFDTPVLDLTRSNLEGCYRELRHDFKVAIEQRSNGKKYVTRWGSWERGGLQISGRDALYFVRDSWQQCPSGSN